MIEIDLISFLWEALQSWNITSGVIVMVAVGLVCLCLLIKEYGRGFLARLFHRRNRLSLCGVLAFLFCFLALFQTGCFMRFPRGLRVLLIGLYASYIAVVLRSVQGPALFSRRCLSRYRQWLKLGEAHEHSEILDRRPWYFLDQNEKLGYEICKGKYLYELGNRRAAYEVMSEVEKKRELLYPEELADITVDLVFMLLELGAFSKADRKAEGIKEVAPLEYFFLKSYSSELQGNLDDAWRYAQEGEAAIGEQRESHRILGALYTQLGRLSFFRENRTETFHYYYLALEQAKKEGDIRQLHPSYQNLIHQIQLQRAHEDEAERLMEEYMAAVAGASLKNRLELANFRVSLARQNGDRDAEYEAIMTGYRSLHKMTAPPEQYVTEISALGMLTNGSFDAGDVLRDIAGHFDDYFKMPLPGRFTVLQGMTRPVELTDEQAAWYEAWTPRLVNYAQNQALKDLDQYERSLPTDCVNERCWVLQQRIDFTRRGGAQYDGQRVLQWQREIIRIYQNNNQAFREVEAELVLVKQYDEMIGLGQLQPEADTLGQMHGIVADAFTKAKRLPPMTVGGLFIDLAYFSAKLADIDQAIEALDCYRKSNLSPNHLSLELRNKLALLEQRLPLPR